MANDFEAFVINRAREELEQAQYLFENCRPNNKDIFSKGVAYRGAIYNALQQAQKIESEECVVVERKRLERIAGLRKHADDVIGMVDNPHHKALNRAVQIATELLATPDERKDRG